MPTDFGNLDLSQLMKIANSPAGQELISLVQEKRDEAFDEAMRKAEAGDYSQAKAALTRMLSTEQAQKLLNQIRGEA